MKIYDFLFVSPILIGIDGKLFNGGAELHLKNIIDTLKNKGNIGVIQKSFKGFSYNETIDGIDYYFVGAKSDFLFKLKLKFILNKITSRVIHFNYTGLERFISKKNNIIYTATYHGTLWDFPTNNFDGFYVSNSFYKKIGAFFYKKLFIYEQNKSIKKLDKILSVDSSLLRYTQQFFTEYREKIFPIYNFVDLNNFKNISFNNKEKYFNILYPRNISFARGVHLLVPIAKKLISENINFKFTILGGSINEIGGGHYEKKLRQEILNNGLTDYFIFTGRVEHSNISKYFNASDLIFIPTFFSEGTSLACLEGMANRKIVLATNIGGLMDLIIDGYNGFLSNPNSEALSDKIIYIFNNIEKLNYIVDNSYNIVCNNYSLDIWKTKILNFFDITYEK